MNFQTLPCQVQMLELQHISPTIIQNANFGVLVVDLSFNITFMNKAACEILNIPADASEASLYQVLDKVSDSGSETLLQAFSDTLSSRIEILINGQPKSLEISPNSLLIDDGIKVGTAFLLFDITLEKYANSPAYDDLQLAAIGQLASEIAHELKNPVTVIKGFSQLLLKKKFDDPQIVDFLEIIFKEAERAHLFIQDFLKLGRTKRLRKTPINLPNLVTDSAVEIEKQCFLNNIEIVQQIETSCKILGDYEQLKQALVNLGKNAVEAMDNNEHPKRLTFILAKDTSAKTILIKVIDSGKGIPSELRDKIMTPFFTTKKYGTGLGLSITKSIIEQHGGEANPIHLPPRHNSNY